MRNRAFDHPEYPILKELIRAGKCVAFIGSGLSLGSYPSWNALIERLCEATGAPVPDGMDGLSADEKLDLADQAFALNPLVYHDVISDIFGREDIVERLAYIHLVNLPFRSFLTLNFDPLIMLTASAIWPTAPLVLKYPALMTSELKSKSIQYLHGLVEPGGNHADGEIILSKRDFESAYETDSGGLLIGLLRECFAYFPTVFIGCSLSEPPIRRILERAELFRSDLGARFESPPPAHYMFLATINRRVGEDGESVVIDEEAEQSEAEQYAPLGIHIIRYDPVDRGHSGLEKILEDIRGIEPPALYNPYA